VPAVVGHVVLPHRVKDTPPTPAAAVPGRPRMSQFIILLSCEAGKMLRGPDLDDLYIHIVDTQIKVNSIHTCLTGINIHFLGVYLVY
jgi:hypothetical protein